MVRKAADQDSPNAMMNIGILYENGLGLKKNLEEASAWYKKADEFFNKADPGGYDGARKAYELVEEILSSPQTGKVCVIDPDSTIFESPSTLAGCYKADGSQIPEMIDMMIKNKQAFKILGKAEALIDWTYSNMDYCAIKSLKEKSRTFYIHKKCLTCPRGQTIDYK